MKRYLALPILVSATLAAQTFDVVSIRPSPPGMVFRSQDFTPVQPGGGYVDSNTNLLYMITFAYNVQNPSRQLVGLPDLAKQSYAVAAQAGDDYPVLSETENLERVRAMLCAMLEDRFKLRMHTETREESVFRLTTARGGIRLKEAAAPVPPEKEGMLGGSYSDAGGRMVGQKVTMDGMAKVLTTRLNRTVVNQTGLTGYYNIDERWTSPDAAASRSGFSEEGTSLLISVLDDQFGLRLENAKAPVPYWVVDHVEEPSEN